MIIFKIEFKYRNKKTNGKWITIKDCEIARQNIEKAKEECVKVYGLNESDDYVIISVKVV